MSSVCFCLEGLLLGINNVNKSVGFHNKINICTVSHCEVDNNVLLAFKMCLIFYRFVVVLFLYEYTIFIREITPAHFHDVIVIILNILYSR